MMRCQHFEHSAAAAMQTAWLTPAELFQPWYGQAVAKYILRHHSRTHPRAPLSVIEVGGGHGTLARDILVRLHLLPCDGKWQLGLHTFCCRRRIHAMPETCMDTAHSSELCYFASRICDAILRVTLVLSGGVLQDHIASTSPQVYQRFQYTSIEASPGLAKAQQQRLASHKQFSVITGDARQAATWQRVGKARAAACTMVERQQLPNACVVCRIPNLALLVGQGIQEVEVMMLCRHSRTFWRLRCLTICHMTRCSRTRQARHGCKLMSQLSKHWLMAQHGRTVRTHKQLDDCSADKKLALTQHCPQNVCSSMKHGSHCQTL